MSTMTTWTTHPDRARSGDKKQRKKMKNETVQTATQVKINDSEGQKNAKRDIYDISTIKRATRMGSWCN